MDKIWLKHYPPGIPSEVNLQEYASLPEIVEKTCARFRELPAFSNMGATLSYSQLDAATRDFAAYLQKVLQLQKGERIALMMPNLLQYPVAMFGALRAGLTVVNCNPLYTPRELEHQLKDSGATSIVVLENFAHTLQQVIARTAIKSVITTQVGDLLPLPKALLTNFVVKHLRHMVPAWRIEGAVSFKDTLAAGRSRDLAPVPLGHDDLAFLQYTGGTTGVAKGAMLTHGNMVANLQQVSVIGEDGKERYRYYTCGQDHDSRNPAWKPFQHLSGYCQELGYDFYEARDMIEERIGRKLKCECELLRNSENY